MKRNLWIAAASLLLALCLLGVTGCGDGEESGGETTVGISEADTTAEDTTAEDTTVGDTTVEGTTVEDTTVEDITAPDTTAEDTTVEDTTVPDTTVEDTTVEDTTVPDTTIEDTTAEDTTVPDTTVEDTTVEDTTVPETTAPVTTEEPVTTEVSETDPPETACVHDYQTVTTLATCAKAGSKVTTCTKCGDTKTETIPATGHAYETVTTPATCAKAGSKVTTCTKCGDTKTETIPATGHAYETITTPPTPAADGEIRTVCGNCGDTEVEVLPAIGRDFVAPGSLSYVGKVGNYVYLDVATTERIALGGIARPADNNGEYFRLDAANKGAYPEDIQREGATMAGGTLRFRVYGGSFRIKALRRTDVDYVVRDNYGFDIYLGTGTNRTLWKQLTASFYESYESEELVLPEGVQEVMICLPRTVGFTSLQIAFSEDAYVAAPPARKGGAIGFYGSSITQGYTASSPSLSYAMQLCLAYDADCVNFGLSGAARGEKAVIDDMCAMIKDAGLTAFILDYDWNINSSTELREGSAYWNSYPYATIYGKIRAAIGADAPIVMLSRPFFGRGTAGITGAEVTKCIRVIEGACEDAIEAGDTKVGFISGKTFFPEEEQGACHVGDKVHPSDLGHAYMAAAVKPMLDKLLAGS